MSIYSSLNILFDAHEWSSTRIIKQVTGILEVLWHLWPQKLSYMSKEIIEYCQFTHADYNIKISDPQVLKSHTF